MYVYYKSIPEVVFLVGLLSSCWPDIRLSMSAQTHGPLCLSRHKECVAEDHVSHRLPVQASPIEEIQTENASGPLNPLHLGCG